MRLAHRRALALPILMTALAGGGATAQMPAPVPAPAPASDPLAGLEPAASLVVPQIGSYPLRPGAARAGVHVVSIDARVQIVDRVATTSLDLTLENNADRPDEAVLLVPVPDDAVVTEVALDGGVEAASARVLPAEEARRLYDAIVARLMDPALVEFAGHDLVRTSVFPVPAQGRQTVRLTYEHVLGGDGDRVDYVLPRSESLAGRGRWGIAVDVTAGPGISTVYSPTHAIVPERLAADRFAIRLDTPAGIEPEPGPFRLSFLRDRGDGVAASLLAYPDETNGGGYFLLVAGLPAEPPAAAEHARREVTIVIDRSGSMAGAKMEQARAAAMQVLDGLGPGEAFNIVDYASTVSGFAPAPVVKDDTSRRTAHAYLAALRPSGGTNIHDALVRALEQPPHSGMLPIVLFLTDGLPTIGPTEETTIRRLVEARNPHGRRVFTFGVGEDVNVPLLDRVADWSRARATYVGPDEDIANAVAAVFRRLAGPVLAAPVLRTLDTGGVVAGDLVHDVLPAPLPDLYDGDQFVVLGRYRDAQPISLVLAGDWLGTPREFHYTFDLREATTRHAFVPRLWAGRRIARLIDRIRQREVSPGDAEWAVVEEIVQLSTTHGILTEYTAFLATDGTDLADRDTLVLGCGANLDRRVVRLRSGPAALSQSLNWRRLAGQTTLNARNAFVDDRRRRVEIGGVQQMCDRAFFRRGNRWIDGRLIGRDLAAPPDEVLPLGSPAHTALLRRLATEGRAGVLALSGEILLEVDGRVVLVTDGC